MSLARTSLLLQHDGLRWHVGNQLFAMGKCLLRSRRSFSVRVAPQQAYRRHMPGKWMSLSGLTIEVATRAVHLARTGTFFPSSGYIELEGKGFRTGCSSQVPVNRGSMLVLSGRQWGTLSCAESASVASRACADARPSCCLSGGDYVWMLDGANANFGFPSRRASVGWL